MAYLIASVAMTLSVFEGHSRLKTFSRRIIFLHLDWQCSSPDRSMSNSRASCMFWTLYIVSLMMTCAWGRDSGKREWHAGADVDRCRSIPDGHATSDPSTHRPQPVSCCCSGKQLVAMATVCRSWLDDDYVVHCSAAQQHIPRDASNLLFTFVNNIGPISTSVSSSVVVVN